MSSQKPAEAGASSASKRSNSMSAQSETSQTAADYLRSQLKLEAEARKALPYSIDKCTYLLGPLRQNIFSCLTCNPVPPAGSSIPYTPAGICYSCSVSCHGDHQLVEIFSKRNFTCDCGTVRMPDSSPCTLRVDEKTGKKEVRGAKPSEENEYGQNFEGKFCCCGKVYDPYKMNGIMFQCLGLGRLKEGGCGEDWYHPECLMGIGENWYEKQEGEKMEKQQDSNKAEVELEETQAVMEKSTSDSKPSEPTDSAPAAPAAPAPAGVDSEAPATNEEEDEGEEEEAPLPPGFPEEDSFVSLICFKCVESHSWIKKYVGQPGFLPPLYNTPTPNLDGKNDDVSVENAKKKEQEATGTVREESKAEVVEAAVSLPIHPDSKSKKRKASLTLSPIQEFKRPKSTTAEDTAQASTEPTEPTEPACFLKKYPDPPSSTTPFTLFLLPTFRSHLCPCPTCTPLHLPHPPLLKDESVYAPSLSPSPPASTFGSGSLYDRGESALKNMDRVKAIEGVMAYNMMKEKLKPLFQRFAESGEAMSADDVKEFFEKLRGDEEGMRRAREGAERLSDGRKEQEGQ